MDVVGDRGFFAGDRCPSNMTNGHVLKRDVKLGLALVAALDCRKENPRICLGRPGGEASTPEKRRDTSVTKKNTKIVNLHSKVCFVGSISRRRML